MKKLFEPILSATLCTISYELFKETTIILVMAFFTGAVGYLGRLLMQHILKRIKNAKLRMKNTGNHS